MRVFRAEMAVRNVAMSDAAQFLPGLTAFSRCLWERCRPRAFAAAPVAAQLAMALPIFTDVTQDQILHVLEAVRQAVKRSGAL